MSITFSSCFYIMKSKFGPEIYIEWMNNFISIVNNFNLVIYTNEESSKFIDTKNNPRIKVIIKELTSFYNYKYKDFWIANHEKNIYINNLSCWELNMLWSEKIPLVKETIDNKYFITELYGWCDIGYFRNRGNDLNTRNLSNWCNIEKIEKTETSIDKTKIIYGCVNNNNSFTNMLYNIINNKNQEGLPVKPIPVPQISIAGGFFILHKDNIDWWFKTYDEKVALYFKHNYLVKDDQIILVDCIFSDLNRFQLFKEQNNNYDNWFMFQRILNSNKNSSLYKEIDKLKRFWEYTNTPEHTVSILIASYNTKIEFICDCLNSITNQIGNFGIELVWIDDGSDEKNTKQIEKVFYSFGFNKNFLKIKNYKLSQNKGLSYALNYGVNNCSNELIFRMDADDIMHETRIITQLNFMINNQDCVLCGTDILPFSDIDGQKKQVDKLSNHPERLTWEEYKTKKHFWILNHPTLCFKKSAVLEVGNYDKNLRLPFEDLDLELRILKKYGAVYNIKQVLLLYRIHPEQITLKNSKNTQLNNELKKKLIEKIILE